MPTVVSVFVKADYTLRVCPMSKGVDTKTREREVALQRGSTLIQLMCLAQNEAIWHCKLGANTTLG